MRLSDRLCLEAHAAHSTHAAHAAHAAHSTHAAMVVVVAVTTCSFLRLWLFADRAVACEDEPRDARRILECGTVDLRRRDHALLHKVTILKRECVEAFVALHLLDLGNDDRSLFA